MKSIFKEISHSVIILSILMILLGIVLVAYPGLSMFVAGIIVGVSMIVYGIALIILDIRASIKNVPFDGMLPGILLIILGTLISWDPFGWAFVLTIYIGIYVIVTSVSNIKTSISLRGQGVPWVLMLIISIVDLLIGLFIFFSPVFASFSITIAAGIVLIVHSVFNIIDMLVIKSNLKKMEKLANA